MLEIIGLIGMDSVMAKFNKSNLSEIRSEFLSSLDPTQPVPPLPKYMGGSEAQLLIGIKNTSLDPVWIKTLPSGVAVYRSVFRDMWGSNIIFAGPHKTFTDANRVCTINYSSIESRPIARNDGWSDDLLMHDLEYSVVINNDLCDLYPSARINFKLVYHPGTMSRTFWPLPSWPRSASYCTCFQCWLTQKS